LEELSVSDKKDLDKPLLIASVSIVLAVVVSLSLFPEQSSKGASWLFNLFTMIFGTPVLLGVFLAVLLLTGIALSKYGNIKLGEGKPEYATYSWVAMMICAGLGSATVYWAFVEWAYYFNGPPLGIAAGSPMAYEFGTAYNLFHWGISAWGTYCIAALPVAYHFHVRRNLGLSLSSVCTAIRNKPNMTMLWKGATRVIDFIFIFTCFGALSITLGVSVPMVSEILCSIFNATPTFGVNLGLIITISAVFSFSSYIGISKGMRRISDINTYMAIAFCLAIFIVGPTVFIMKNTVNGLGTMFQNYIRMSLWTDPIGNSGFPEGWTIFYWLYWITYTPFMALFITKVSKGRTLRGVIVNTLISGSCGCFFFFGIIGSYSMYANINEIVPVASMLAQGKDNASIVLVLNSLPLGALFILLFCLVSALFLATTLDSAAYTLAATVTPDLYSGEDPSPVHRLFWCIMLAAVPLAMMFINASLNTIKTAAIVTSIPLCFILCYMVYGMMRWMIRDYGEKSAEQIIGEDGRAPVSADQL
jgi:BCCT family betaine/carnitine transporter